MADDVPKQIKNIVDDFRSSGVYARMIDGDSYYKYKNTAILSRKKQYYSPVYDGDGVSKVITYGELLDDPYLANNKICSGYVPLLVDQLNQYLLAKEVTYDENTNDIIEDNTAFDVEGFEEAIFNAALDAQNKSIGWVYFFIDEGVMRFKRIPSEQVMPIVNENGDIVNIIRAYTLRVVNENGEMEDASIVEVYDNDMVQTYIKFNGDDNYKEWNCYNGTNQRPYIVTKKETVNGEERSETATGFGGIPFTYIEFKGDGIAVLDMVKSLVDIFDVVNSDFSNNFEDFEDAVNVVKGYDGTNMKTFNENIKKYKAVLVESDGDFKRDVKEVPHAARVAFLEMTNDMIFKQGMGVDTTETGDGNITNFVMNAKYKALDNKAEWFAKKIRQFYGRAVVIMNAWLVYSGKPTIEDIKITFNKNILSNPLEEVIALAKGQGFFSNKTLYELASFIEKPEDEELRIKEEPNGIKLEG